MKKLFVILLGSVLLLGIPGMAVAAAGGNPAGWAFENGTWHFYDQGVMKQGWVLDKGKWYFFDGTGKMQKGWINEGGKWYYLDGSGAMKNGWVLVSGTWYYLNGSGVMKTGWVFDRGTWYYLDSSGAMKTGWLSVSGTWYYLDRNGAMVRQNFVSGYYLMNDGRMTYAGSPEVVSVVEGLKKWVDVGITQSELQAKLGSEYHDLVGIEGEKYWLYTLKGTDGADYQAVKVAGDDLGAEELANGSADIIVLVFWDGYGKAIQVTMDYFNAAHKFHHYHSSRYDYEYN